MNVQDQQIIVQIVGPDMSGKTEIAKALSERLGIPYFKSSSERNTYLTKQEQFIQQLRHADPRMVDFLKQTGHSVVFDRGYPCEWSYSKVMNRATDEDALQAIDLAYATLNTKIVVCYRKNYDGIVDDIDKKIDANVLTRLELEYRRFADWSACDVLFLSVDDEDLNREVDEILEWLKEFEFVVPGSIDGSASSSSLVVNPSTRSVAIGRCWGCCQENCGYRKCSCVCHPWNK